jgi:hypothetical protein
MVIEHKGEAAIGVAGGGAHLQKPRAKRHPIPSPQGQGDVLRSGGGGQADGATRGLPHQPAAGHMVGVGTSTSRSVKVPVSKSWRNSRAPPPAAAARDSKDVAVGTAAGARLGGHDRHGLNAMIFCAYQASAQSVIDEGSAAQQPPPPAIANSASLGSRSSSPRAGTRGAKDWR